MTKKDKRELITTLIGGASGMLAQYYITVLLKSIFAPKTIVTKIGAMVVSGVIGGIMTKYITKELDELCESVEGLTDDLKSMIEEYEEHNKEIEESVITATTSEES